VQGARAIFDRWCEWEPDDHAWSSYVRLEMRANQPGRARKVHERWVSVHNFPRAWLKWAKFEEKQGETALARAVYEGSLQNLDERDHTEEIFIAFAQFEERAKEADRARVIYKYALEQLPKSDAQELYKKYVLFEKQHGDRSGIEDVIAAKKRFQYEEVVKRDPYMYDTWYDYVRLEESFVADAAEPDYAPCRDVYERAIANVPPAPEKRLWRRYIYLWLRYAIFEELIAKNATAARDVLASCRKLLPHASFTFAKVWVHAAHFEVRQGELGAARKLLGNAIGRCPKEKLFKEYIQLELQLGEVTRCRQLYNQYLQWNPANCAAWVSFAELEASLGELERCRAIYDLAIGQGALDMPEALWKSYIDFEISEGEIERTRALYRALLERTKHVKVWVSYAKYEGESAGLDAAAAVFQEAEDHFKEGGQKDERVLVLEAHAELLQASGDASRLKAVTAKMPTRLKKKRPLQADDGSSLGWEEYYDYVFPEEQAKAPSLKLLEMAHKWKRQKVEDD